MSQARWRCWILGQLLAEVVAARLSLGQRQPVVGRILLQGLAEVESVLVLIGQILPQLDALPRLLPIHRIIPLHLFGMTPAKPAKPVTEGNVQIK